ncbi:uncharacterized protein ASPGLDRAFT_57183, partial [Aspergillus glaucus CBS 516.65]
MKNEERISGMSREIGWALHLYHTTGHWKLSRPSWRIRQPFLRRDCLDRTFVLMPGYRMTALLPVAVTGAFSSHT